MLAAHAAPDTQDLYTISANGFSATADAFARDPDSEGRLVPLDGRRPERPQGNLGRPPQAPARDRTPARRHGRGGALGRLPPLRSAVRDARHVDDEDRPPAGQRRLARDGVHPPRGVRLRAGRVPACSPPARTEAPGLHHRFLDRRSPLPLHRNWADWLWHRGLTEGEIVPLQSAGIAAYRCNPGRRGAARGPLARRGGRDAHAAA